MKKFVAISISLILILCIFGCKSSKQEKPADDEQNKEQNEASAENNPVPEKKDDNRILIDQDSTDIDIDAINRAAEQEEKILSESPFGHNPLGETRKGSGGRMGNLKANIEHQIGAVKIKAKGKHGSFNIYSIDEKGKSTPVFSPLEEFTGTSFYLLYGKKVYKLSGGDGNSGAEKTTNGIRLYYLVPNIASVTVDFAIFKSDPNYDADMVKVSANVKSLSSRTNLYALKLVMDTVLGEKSKYHFYNSDNLPIKTEVMYRTMQKTKWIMSKNDDTSLQLLLSGADISPVDFVAVANNETLNTVSWEPNMLTERNFNTVRSYNNSAIDINWLPQELTPDQDMTYVFYIALASDSNVPKGEAFIAANTKSLDDEMLNAKPASDAEKRKFDFVDFDFDKAKSGDVSPEYIQRILERIASLEESDPDLNHDELVMLNNELDLILNSVRKQ